jgi:hypothetical protein
MIMFWPLRAIIGVLALASITVADSFIESSALMSCMDNSEFSASSFSVKFFPDNKTVVFDISAISTIDGNVTANIEVIAYGLTIVNREISGCNIGDVSQLCPLQPGHFDIESSVKISSDITNDIPGIAYTIPDLDGVVKVTVYMQNTGQQVACVEATLSNGKTVQTKYASWAIGAVCVVGLLSAGLVSVAGHQSTASHIASNVVSLFVYFQSVAIVGMMAVEKLPPIAAAWSQNFQWTMGLMRLGFMQSIFSWYVQATGGTATNLLPNKNAISIEVEKRDLNGLVPFVGNFVDEHVRNGMSKSMYRTMAVDAVRRSGAIFKRATSSNTTSSASSVTTNEKDPNLASMTLVLRGMQRVAYLANIELSNVFLTGITFFIVLGIIIILVLAAFKGIIELLVKMGAIHHDKFMDYRQNWRVITKGVLFRLFLVGFAQLSVLCLWELVEQDSPAVIVLAIVSYIIVLAILGIAAFRVIQLARTSMRTYKNPAYILFSDSKALNRYGFLYVQFRATAYYFIVPVLIYTLLKAIFIAFGQASGKAQALGIFLVELAYLIAISWLKPYMDKRTNGFNIGISAINFVNALFFLFFSNLFGQPAVVSSVMAVVFFVLNAVFSLVLLIMIIVLSVWGLLAPNPDSRYQPMRDDRQSFIPDNQMAPEKKYTELDALGATARDGYMPGSDVFGYDEEERSSRTSEQLNRGDNSAFPQARLPRQPTLMPYGQERAMHSSSSLESPVRSESPMPASTTYRGYVPANEPEPVWRRDPRYPY